jgi:hypothetical protein
MASKHRYANTIETDIIEKHVKLKYNKIEILPGIKIAIDRAKRSLIKIMTKNPMKLYGYVRSVQSVKSRVAWIRRKDGTVTTIYQEMANVLTTNNNMRLYAVFLNFEG